VEIVAHGVSCPGAYLARRDDIYVTISLFGQTRRTLFSSSLFPLLFNDKFYFEKVFYGAYTAGQVTDDLANHLVTVELIQCSDLLSGDVLLAEYTCSALDLLYPYTTYSAQYGVNHREIVMDKTFDLHGSFSPRFEFSSYVDITSRPLALDTYIPDPIVTTTRLRSRSPSPMRSSLARIRSRSMSPVRSAGRIRARSMSPVRASYRAISPVRTSTVYDDYLYGYRPYSSYYNSLRLEKSLDDLALARARRRSIYSNTYSGTYSSYPYSSYYWY